MKKKNSIIYVVNNISFLLAFISVYSSKCMDIPLPNSIGIIENVLPVHRFKVSKDSISSLALSSHNDFLVVGTSNTSRSNKLSVFLLNQEQWNSDVPKKNIFSDPQLEPNIGGYPSTQELAVSNDDKTIIGQSNDYIWKWDIGKHSFINFGKLKVLYMDKRVLLSRIIPNKNEIIVNQNLREDLINPKYISAQIYDLTSGKLLRSLEGAHQHLSDLAVNRSGTRVGGVLKDGSAYIWDAKTGTILKELNVDNGFGGKKTAKKQLITTMYISERYIVTYGMNDEVRILDVKNFEEVKSWKLTAMQHVKDPLNYHPNVQISELKITTDEKFIIFTTNVEGWIGIIDIEKEKIVRFKISDYQSSTDWPTCFIISNDSKNIVVGDAIGVVKIFDIEEIMENKPIKKLAFDINVAKNSLQQLTSSLNSLSYK